MKTADFGYDGKGQFRIKKHSDLDSAWEGVGRREAVLEAFIPFELELSVVAARTADGQFVHYGAVENRHVNGILDVTIAPGRVSSEIAAMAVS